MTENQNLIGPVSPTPVEVYEPRILRCRIWIKGGPFEGIGFFSKAPYGQAANLAYILARAVCRWQITRYQFAPATARNLRTLDRKALKRPEDVLAEIGERYGLNWSA